MRQILPLASAIIGTAGFDICHKLAGERINNFLGPVFVGGVEILLSGIYFLIFYRTYSNGNLLFTAEGAIAVAGVGLFAWMIDIGLLELYYSGSSLSTVAPFVITAALALSVTFGITALGEAVTSRKIIGIILSLMSCYLLLE